MKKITMLFLLSVVLPMTVCTSYANGTCGANEDEDFNTHNVPYIVPVYFANYNYTQNILYINNSTANSTISIMIMLNNNVILYETIEPNSSPVHYNFSNCDCGEYTIVISNGLTILETLIIVK